MSSEPSILAHVASRLRALHADEEGDAIIDSTMLVALVVVPLFLTVPPFFIKGNAAVFDHVSAWTNLPYL